MKTLVLGEKMGIEINSLFYYISATGGSGFPFTIKDNEICFELLTAGAVYSPLGDDVMKRGWVFCHYPGEQTVWNSPEGEHYECLVVNFQANQKIYRSDWKREFFWGEADSAVSFAHEVLHAFQSGSIPREIINDYVWSQLRFRNIDYIKHQAALQLPPQVSMVKNFIEKYYMQDLVIAELAKHADISESHLHLQFKEYLSTTPHQYIIEQRMQAARSQLVTTLEPLKAISRSVGYANIENFCRAFKKRFKVTAATYRKKHTILE